MSNIHKLQRIIMARAAAAEYGVALFIEYSYTYTATYLVPHTFHKKSSSESVPSVVLHSTVNSRISAMN
jgi:hypothetical protein